MQLSRLHFTAFQEVNNHTELASSSRFHNTLTPWLIISNQHLNTSFSKVSFLFCKYFHRKPDARLSLLSPCKSREAICKVYQKTAEQSIAHSPFQLQEVCHGQKVVGTHTEIQQNKNNPSFSLCSIQKQLTWSATTHSLSFQTLPGLHQNLLRCTSAQGWPHLYYLLLFIPRPLHVFVSPRLPLQCSFCLQKHYKCFVQCSKSITMWYSTLLHQKNYSTSHSKTDYTPFIFALHEETFWKIKRSMILLCQVLVLGSSVKVLVVGGELKGGFLCRHQKLLPWCTERQDRTAAAQNWAQQRCWWCLCDNTLKVKTTAQQLG